MGPGGTHFIVLRESADVTAGSLPIAHQMSWQSGEVPLKVAKITPIHQQVMKEEPGHYRPASPTSVPGQVMEKFVLGDMERHL